MAWGAGTDEVLPRRFLTTASHARAARSCPDGEHLTVTRGTPGARHGRLCTAILLCLPDGCCPGRRLVCSGEPPRGRRPWWTEGHAARQAPSPWSVASGLVLGALRVLGASRASGWPGPPPIQAGATMDQEDCSGAGGHR
jgi:hypothetical protein